MKILIKGAGLTGCVMARLLVDDGHDVVIVEKEKEIGGLCATGSNEGLYYDKFGPHYFRSSDTEVTDFILPFFNLNNNSHYVGSYINGRFFDWPISEDNVSYFENIFGNRACYSCRSTDVKNFDKAAKNMFGPILYELFIKNYTENMWHRDPKELSAKMCPSIFHVNGSDKRYFRKTYQGYPEYGYSAALTKMIEGIPISYDRFITRQNSYDITIDCSPIDDVHNYSYGKLGYVGMKFVNEILKTPKAIETIPSIWYRYSCLNFPNCEFDYIRATVYKNMTRQLHQHEIVGYEYPSLTDTKTHPVISNKNEERIINYLHMAANSKNVIPAGRMGLFKYLSMDTAIKTAIKISKVVSGWKSMNSETRCQRLMDFREVK